MTEFKFYPKPAVKGMIQNMLAVILSAILLWSIPGLYQKAQEGQALQIFANWYSLSWPEFTAQARTFLAWVMVAIFVFLSASIGWLGSICLYDDVKKFFAYRRHSKSRAR